MPRIVGPNSCLTCRRRKVRCDETIPTCTRCQKGGFVCQTWSEELRVKQYAGPNQDGNSEPSHLLQDPHTADLFQIYIKELAPWYDLNDVHCTFARQASVRALDSPLLFCAALALAALYTSRKAGMSTKLAEEFHGRCSRHLVAIAPGDAALEDGTALAATCLLRSYEILKEAKDPNIHLFGASALVPQSPPGFADTSLTAAGYWNFLREDITYSLIHGCKLKVQVERSSVPVDQICQDQLANAVTLVLARTVNWYFTASNAKDEHENARSALQADLEGWREAFQAKPFVDRIDPQTMFPRVAMIEDSQAAALHYYYVARCMLTNDINARRVCATRVVGLAMFLRSDAVVVNAYGPLCFTAKWIGDQAQGVRRRNLVKWLEASEKRTAWSVKVIVDKLEAAWRDEVEQ